MRADQCRNHVPCHCLTFLLPSGSHRASLRVADRPDLAVSMGVERRPRQISQFISKMHIRLRILSRSLYQTYLNPAVDGREDSGSVWLAHNHCQALRRFIPPPPCPLPSIVGSTDFFFSLTFFFELF